MEDQTAAVVEVGGITVIVLLVGGIGVLNGCTGANTILTQEGDVVGLVDLDTSDLIQTLAGSQVALGISEVAVENVGVYRGNKTVISNSIISNGPDYIIIPEGCRTLLVYYIGRFLNHLVVAPSSQDRVRLGSGLP